MTQKKVEEMSFEELSLFLNGLAKEFARVRDIHAQRRADEFGDSLKPFIGKCFKRSEDVQPEQDPDIDRNGVFVLRPSKRNGLTAIRLSQHKKDAFPLMIDYHHIDPLSNDFKDKFTEITKEEFMAEYKSVLERIQNEIESSVVFP